MLVVHEYTTDPHACAYLPDRLATMQHALTASLSAEEYENLMNRCYRKFGMSLFRPVCGACQACRPLRVPAAEFRPGRSQRRAWKLNQDLEVRIGEPLANAIRLELFRRYHAAQAERKGWSENEIAGDEYAFNFVLNPVPSLEVSVWEGSALRAVLLADITPNVVSAVYHYHDPECAGRGLGTFGVLQAIELARRLQKTWVYLGFYVAGCQSLSYKSRFRPCEIMEPDGVWREME